MANLILDIGNTRTKAALFEGEELLAQQSADSLEAIGLQTLMGAHKVTGAIASVVGKRPDFEAALPTALQGRLHLLSHRSKLPLRIDYQTPATLGMDRVAAAVGAWAQCPGTPLVVVDAGSCITIDFVDSTGVYHGGAILPGIRLKLRSLHDYTAALPQVAFEPTGNEGMPPLTGKSTEESIAAGVLTATVFEIQGFIASYQARYGAVKLFLTGGDALYFANLINFPKFADQALVLRGLNKILELNA